MPVVMKCTIGPISVSMFQNSLDMAVRPRVPSILASPSAMICPRGLLISKHQPSLTYGSVSARVMITQEVCDVDDLDVAPSLTDCSVSACEMSAGAAFEAGDFPLRSDLQPGCRASANSASFVDGVGSGSARRFRRKLECSRRGIDMDSSRFGLPVQTYASFDRD